MKLRLLTLCMTITFAPSCMGSTKEIRLKPLGSPPLKARDEAAVQKQLDSSNHSGRGRWYVDVGVAQGFPLLHESQSEIGSAIDRPISIFGIEKSPVRTFQDWRREGLLLTPLVGVGHEFNEWFSFGGRFGASMGRQRNARMLLTGTLDADFEYSVGIAELYGLLYPFQRPQPAENANFAAVLESGRPLFSHALSITRFVQRAEMALPIGPLAYEIEKTNDDVIPGYHLGAGWEWAISESWSVRATGTYGFYFDRGQEFNGFVASISFAFRF